MSPITRRDFARFALSAAPFSPLLTRSLLAKESSIDDVLKSAVDQKKVPAVVAMAGTAGSITYTGAFGKRDSASSVPVSPESIFAIASMTKAVTSAAAMQLVEQGKMTIDEPASKHLPELGMLQVLD